MFNFLKKFFSKGGSVVSVPTVMQIEATECGVNRDDSKAGNIIKAARRRNCNAKGFRIIADSLRVRSR